MATTTPNTKTKTKTTAGRTTGSGPRRTSTAARQATATEPDLEQLREQLHAAILEEHPGSDLTVAKEQRIADVLERRMNQHRLIVGPSVIEQDFEATKLIDGDRGPLHGLRYQITRVVRVKDPFAQDNRLVALAGAVA